MKEGIRSVLIQSPTGSGKTALTANMLHAAAKKGMRSWFVVHRKELIDQSARAFKLEGLQYGLIASGYAQNRSANVQIAGIGTLIRRMYRYHKPNLIVWDECHHAAARSWSSVFEAFPDSYHVGLTATPERLDGRGLNSYFQKMIHGPSVSWLIENGFLSKYKLYAPANVDLSQVPRRMGDYARSELAGAVDKPKITGSAIEHYKRLAYGKRALVFCVSVAHSRHVAEQFRAAGFAATHVDGDTPTQERTDAMRRFQDGNIQVLTSVDIFGEGVDVPALECVMLLRPTQSLGLYLQQIGRSLRPSPGKEAAIILDHVGNCERFGLPDQEREWSLEGRQKSSGDFKLAVRICPECFGAQPPSPICIFCKMVFALKPREIQTVSGELKEVDAAAQLALKLKWKREQGQTQSFAELVNLGIQRHYKRPHAWAAMILKGRQAKKMKGVV